MINRSLKKIGEDIRKFLESNENKNKTYQNFWDTAKSVLRGKFISTSNYIKKQRSQINNLMIYFEILEQ
jgi:hypothetical protein